MIRDVTRLAVDNELHLNHRVDEPFARPDVT